MNKIHRLKRIQKLHKVATSSRGLFGDFSNGPSLPGEQAEFSMPKRKRPLAERVPLPRPPKDPLVAAREAAERESRPQEIVEEIYPPMLMDETFIPYSPPTKTPKPRPTPKPLEVPSITYMEWDDPIMPPHSNPRRPIATPPDPEWMDAPELPATPKDPDWMDAPDPRKWREILREMDAPEPINLKKSNRSLRIKKLSQLLK